MKCIFFSDLHIKKPNDEAENLFNRLCQTSQMKDASHLFLLGDLFDLLIGEHDEYFTHYHVFFNHIIKLLEAGKIIVYLEGNHDFHFGESIYSFLQSKTSFYKNFKYLKDGESFHFGERRFYVCHGDEVDDLNESFKKWKKVYTSKQFAFFINKILSFTLIQKIGSKVSQNSKSRGSKTFNLEKMKQKYIEGAERLIASKQVDGVICGHTHIQELITFTDQTMYINTGYPLGNKNFLHFDSKKFEFINLEGS